MAPPPGAAAAAPEPVSREAFEGALRQQDTAVIRDIGRRLAWRRALLEKAMRDLQGERAALKEENARLHQSIAATIRELSRCTGGVANGATDEDLTDIASHLWQWVAEPCGGGPVEAQEVVGEIVQEGRRRRVVGGHCCYTQEAPEAPGTRRPQSPRLAGGSTASASSRPSTGGQGIPREASSTELFVGSARTEGACCAEPPEKLPGPPTRARGSTGRVARVATPSSPSRRQPRPALPASPPAPASPSSSPVAPPDVAPPPLPSARPAPTSPERATPTSGVGERLAAFGSLVSRQFSGAFALLTEGSDPLFAGTCGKKGPCCDSAVAASGPAAPAPAHGNRADAEMDGGLWGLKEHQDKPPSLENGWSASMGTLDATGVLAAVRRQRVEEQREAQATEPTTAPSASARDPAAAGREGQGTVLVEVHLHLEGLDLGPCTVCATERCSEVAANFIAEHSLKPMFEAPLAAYLKKAEVEAVRFPVHLRADLMEIRAKHVTGAL